jgi:small-conductance mechanosensitive channel
MSELLDYFNTTYSPYTKAAITILFFMIMAGVADIVVSRLVKRFTRFTKTEIDDKLVALIHKPFFFTVLLIGIILSISYLELSEKVVFYPHGIIYSTIVIIWFFTLIRISNLFIEHAMQKRADASGLQNNMIPFIENISKIILVVAVLMALLSLWKINITPLIASAGIAGAAIAFAAKDTIANFFGGISLFMDKPFKIGDYVILDQGERGEVVEIGIRSTRIKTRDDVLITIPNSIISNTKIINESAPVPKFRLRIPFPQRDVHVYKEQL